VPLLIVVAVLIVAGVIWRARVTRRLTLEESVDRYRRTLSAMHDATIRSQDGETAAPAATPFTPRPSRALGPPSRRVIAGAVAAAATVVVVAIVATHHGGGGGRPDAQALTTTRPTAPTTTTTTVAAPTTTAPLVRVADPTGTAFTIGRSSYSLVLQSTNGACWIDARDPAGTSLFTGLLSDGGSQTITASNATVRLGNPGAVTVTVDGAPVPFRTHNGAPVTLHFQGATA
jgi:cytoskeletal protein RodZ